MPELPEVETIRRDLAGVVLNKKITDLQIIKPRVLKNHSKQFKKNLIGNQITAVSRRGKMLILKLKNPPKFLLIHLKMTGQLIYKKQQDKSSLPDKHTRVFFQFKDGSRLFFNDVRRFGWMRIIKNIKEITYNFGPDPFKLTAAEFEIILSKSAKPIKLLLMDQEKIAGIGNIYANEALFEAGILPSRPAKALSDEEIKKMIMKCCSKEYYDFCYNKATLYVPSISSISSLSKLNYSIVPEANNLPLNSLWKHAKMLTHIEFRIGS